MSADRDRLAAALAEHQVLVGPRDSERPNVWFRWCICGWDGGALAAGEAGNDNRSYRAHIADVLLSTGGVVQALVAEGAAAAEERGYERARRDYQFQPSGDNHHNAALCPYCSPPSDRAAALTAGSEANR